MLSEAAPDAVVELMAEAALTVVSLSCCLADTGDDDSGAAVDCDTAAHSENRQWFYGSS